MNVTVTNTTVTYKKQPSFGDTVEYKLVADDGQEYCIWYLSLSHTWYLNNCSFLGQDQGYSQLKDF